MIASRVIGPGWLLLLCLSQHPPLLYHDPYPDWTGTTTRRFALGMPQVTHLFSRHPLPPHHPLSPPPLLLLPSWTRIPRMAWLRADSAGSDSSSRSAKKRPAAIAIMDPNGAEAVGG
jgi:hypothetical protein